MKAKSIVGVAGLVGLALCVAAPASFAQSAADYYKKKNVRITVGTGPGGGYDTYARMFAPYLQKRLGATVIVENRPGGSMMIGMQYVYQAAPDGLNLMLAPGEGAVLGTLMQLPGIRFDLTKYPVIARLNTAPRVLIVNPKLPYRTLEDILKAGKTVSMGFAGKTDGAADTATVLCHALKLSCRAIIGYASSKDFTLAAIRGEVDGTVITDDSASRFSKGGQLRPIAVTGRERSGLMPDVPTVFEAAKPDKEGAWWLDFRDDVRRLGRLLVTTPGTPADRLAYLREAVRDVSADAEVVAAFNAKNLPLQYAPGEEMEKIIKSLLGGQLSEARIKEIRYVIGEKYYKK